MMLLLGLCLIPVSIWVLVKERDFKTTEKQKTLLDFGLFALSALFIYVTFLVNKEPFTFEIESGRDYLLYTALIFLFTPFLWINFGHFLFGITKRLRIRKNAKIKNKEQFIYYRDTLDKLSPGLVMYIRSLELDIKKAISSSILKLKLTKNIKENKDKFTIEKTDNLLKSEEMIIDLIKDDKFDQKKYGKELEKEALDNGFIKRNRGSIFIKILKVIIFIILPVINTIGSIKFDSYVFDEYPTYIYNHERYVLIEDEIGDIHYGRPAEAEKYYHGYVKEIDEYFYDKSLLSADLTEYETVRKTNFMQALDAIYVMSAMLLDIVFIYLIIEELVYIKRKYKRTRKGIDIINKSYALRNFLKDFSDIQNKSEKDLILWEYYLVYSVALGVNEKINDKLIDKYIK